MRSLNVCRLCCMLCSDLLLSVFFKKKRGKNRKIGNKKYLCLRRNIGRNREKIIEKGGNVVGHFMVATGVKWYKCYGVKKAHFCKCWLSFFFFVVAISRSIDILFCR